jgi:hypothetical protein
MTIRTALDAFVLLALCFVPRWRVRSSEES